MSLGRKVFEFLKAGAIAQAKWDYEVSMKILRHRRKMVIVLAALLPVFVAMAVEASSILGGKTAYAPAFYSTKIFFLSMAIGLVAGLITGCIGAGGGLYNNTSPYGSRCQRNSCCRYRPASHLRKGDNG